LSRPAPGHEIYPYLLRGISIERPNQVWSTDITYVPMQGGFLYLVAIMDWFSRFVLSWELSNTMETGFCLSALEAHCVSANRKSGTPIRAPSSQRRIFWTR
jgi:putative transposase